MIGLHLSAENNCPKMACATLRAAVGDAVAVAAVTRRNMLRALVDGTTARLEHFEIPKKV